MRWNAAGTKATELDNINLAGNGNTNSKALAINSAGTVVGYAERLALSATNSRAFRWEPVRSRAKIANVTPEANRHIAPFERHAQFDRTA